MNNFRTGAAGRYGKGVTQGGKIFPFFGNLEIFINELFRIHGCADYLADGVEVLGISGKDGKAPEADLVVRTTQNLTVLLS